MRTVTTTPTRLNLKFSVLPNRLWGLLLTVMGTAGFLAYLEEFAQRGFHVKSVFASLFSLLLVVVGFLMIARSHRVVATFDRPARTLVVERGSEEICRCAFSEIAILQLSRSAALRGGWWYDLGISFNARPSLSFPSWVRATRSSDGLADQLALYLDGKVRQREEGTRILFEIVPGNFER